MRVYLDSAAVIYIVEQVTSYADLVDSWLSGHEVSMIASDLTRLECRVKPLRDGDVALVKDFDDYFEDAVEILVPLSREIVDLATEIRAKYNFKVPDALHLAAAISSESEVFLTNDHRLDRFRELVVEVIQP